MTTVVTLVRNRTTHLHNLVVGLDATTPDDVPLVVVQMGGEDPAAAWSGTARQVIHRTAAHDGLALALARNLGARVAQPGPLVFLDVDCVPGAGLVETYGAALRDLDAVFMGGVAYLPEDALATAWTISDLRRWSHPHPARPLPPPGHGPCDRPDLFWSLSFGVRRDTFLDRIGGFDEGFVGYGGEDTDFARRAVARGVDLRWLGRAVAHHQHHDTWDPPLPHVADIVANARHFHATWGCWPMATWLAGFARLGLVRWDARGNDVELLRLPTDQEVAAARRHGVISGVRQSPDRGPEWPRS